ncbi:MAG: trimeric intracellular cation channel family protein [Bacteroidia bacterium]|jgi:uncharacterized membrane protein YeiH|nr:trimeric intracellular cation channel family protein [Bacteroidia bacterium]
MLHFPYYLDLFGTLMFAMSGALAASDQKMHRDWFGISFTGFITAIGGGSLRDIMLDIHPLAWIRDAHYVIAIGAGVIVSVVFRNVLAKLRRTLFIFDTLGISVYTILGVQKSLLAGVNPLAAIMLGMFSAVFGGVIRDTLLNETPLIFRKEIYATACLAGASLYVLLDYFGVPPQVCSVCGMVLIAGVRIVAVRYKLSLPKLD